MPPPQYLPYIPWAREPFLCSLPVLRWLVCVRRLWMDGLSLVNRESLLCSDVALCVFFFSLLFSVFRYGAQMRSGGGRECWWRLGSGWVGVRLAADGYHTGALVRSRSVTPAIFFSRPCVGACPCAISGRSSQPCSSTSSTSALGGQGWISFCRWKTQVSKQRRTSRFRFFFRLTR